MVLKIAVGLVFLALIATGGYFIWQRNQSFPLGPAECEECGRVKKQVSWEECIKMSGAVIMEIYPEKCSAPDGSHATRPLSDEEKKNLQPPVGEPTLPKLYSNVQWGAPEIIDSGLFMKENGGGLMLRATEIQAIPFEGLSLSNDLLDYYDLELTQLGWSETERADGPASTTRQYKKGGNYFLIRSGAAGNRQSNPDGNLRFATIYYSL